MKRYSRAERGRRRDWRERERESEGGREGDRRNNQPFALENIIIAEVDKDLAEATLGLFLSDGQIDGADAQENGQEKRLLILADEVSLAVLELAFDIDAESLGPLRQLVPVNVEDVLRLRPARLIRYGCHHEQSDVIGRSTVRHHLPVENRALGLCKKQDTLKNTLKNTLKHVETRLDTFEPSVPSSLL